MVDIRMQKLADLLVNYSIKVKPGDRVLIQGPTIAEPLLREIYAKVIQAGGHPFCLPVVSGTDELLYRYGSEKQLEHIPEPISLIYKTYDCRIYIHAEENTRELTNVNPNKLVTRAKAHRELVDIMMKRTAAGEFRWVLAPYPTNAFAQDAEMSLLEYEDFLFQACMPDLNDPIGYWKRVAIRQQKLVEWFKGKKVIRIKSNQTDIAMSIEGRTFVSCHGEKNIPDGEIYTGPVEESVNGYVNFSYPSIYNGHEVQGIKLWFKEGKIIKASAEKNEDFLLKTINTDEGATYVGELGIGTNEGITRYTREILFDEKINGSFHLALGAGYPETGSKNKSSIHWDMVTDISDGEINVDGDIIYKNGKFLIY